jgi:hypothetical protein
MILVVTNHPFLRVGRHTSTYLAKKIICLLTLDVKKIIACLKYYILYRKEHKFKDKCPRCNASWYKWNDNIEEGSDNNKRKGWKRKNITHANKDSQGSKERKVPSLVIDRLKHMFSNGREAPLLLWHVQQKRDGKIQHHADVRQWKYFDLSHEKYFSNDASNIRFCLGTNGMNPFGEMRNSHTT